jgi:hypothetical protein
MENPRSIAILHFHSSAYIVPRSLIPRQRPWLQVL